VNSALALIEGAAPKDEIEGALAVQMACTHIAAMALLARLQDGYQTERRTSLFVAAEKPTASFDEIVQSVQGWNERKRQIMKPAHIKAAHDRLVAEKWVEVV
jgi:hypothetical protein